MTFARVLDSLRSRCRSGRLPLEDQPVTWVLDARVGDPREDPVTALRAALGWVGELRLLLARAALVPQERLAGAHAEIDLLADTLSQVNLQATELHVRITGTMSGQDDANPSTGGRIVPLPEREPPTPDDEQP